MTEEFEAVYSFYSKKELCQMCYEISAEEMFFKGKHDSISHSRRRLTNSYRTHSTAIELLSHFQEFVITELSGSKAPATNFHGNEIPIQEQFPLPSPFISFEN